MTEANGPKPPRSRRVVDGLVLPPSAQHEALRNAAATVNAHVQELLALARRLGLVEGGPFANGPETDSAERDTARALFVAFRALQLVEGLALDPEWQFDHRSQMRSAHKVLLGGRPDSAKGHHISMAIATARQAIAEVNGVGYVGFPKRPLEEHVSTLKERAAELFGPAMLEVSDSKLTPFLHERGFLSSDEAHAALEKDAPQLAAILLWEAAQLAKEHDKPDQHCFFRLEPGDRDRRRLLSRILTSRARSRPQRRSK
jgi:hypothetical protein